MPWLEISASLLGLISVWLVTKQNSWCWPTGIAMVLMYVYIFYDSRLYSDMLLQFFFAIMQAYGWYFWTKGKSETEKVQVSFLNKYEMYFWSICLILISIVLGTLMQNYTNADLPYIDAITTAMSVIAQWLMTKKKIENWIIWIAADVIYVAMYFYKQLFPTAILYLIFLMLAIKGWIEWKKSITSLKKETEAIPVLP